MSRKPPASAAGPIMRLIHGPYRPPDVAIGEKVEAVLYHRLRDEAEASEAVVTGWSRAKIKWPTGQTGNNSREYVLLCGDLVRAVRIESVSAICHWWGVSRWTVQRWRRALGVDWYTPGTQAAWSEASKRRQHRRGAE